MPNCHLTILERYWWFYLRSCAVRCIHLEALSCKHITKKSINMYVAITFAALTPGHCDPYRASLGARTSSLLLQRQPPLRSIVPAV
jgi:hypothetical protein